MKKLLLIPLLLLTISSCSLLGNKDSGSFADLYKQNTHSSIVSLGELGVFLGINRHESIIGTISTSLSVPGIFSWSISANYDGLIDGRNSESYFRNVRALFSSLVSSGSLSADEVGIISHSSESFLSFKNLSDVGIIPEAARTIIKKYEWEWLNIMEKTQSGMTNEELMGYNIGTNIFKKSLADIEKYITDYPIWKDTADLGMSGSLHFWSVDLDRNNIVALAKKLSLDLAGTGMTDEYVKALEKNLASVSFSWKIGFDPSNPKISLLEGIISVSGKLVAEVTISRNENSGMLRMSNTDDKSILSINYANNDGKLTFDAIAKQSDIEKGKLTGYIEQKDWKFHELSFEASAQGMTVSLKHTLEGGQFNGKLSAVVGTLDWSGSLDDNKLKSLVMNGTTPFGTLSANLTETNGVMIQGPVVVKSVEETIFSANLGLAIAREKFAIILDVISDTMPAHFELDISAKATPSEKKVPVPESSKYLQDLINEINSIESPVIPMDEADTNIAPESIIDSSWAINIDADIQ